MTQLDSSLRRPGPDGPAGGGPRPTQSSRSGQPVKTRRRGSRLIRWLPYLLLLPAVVFELAVHVLPIIVGVAMSFFTITQFQIRKWWEAPFAGFDNFTVVLDFSGPAGAGLLRSFVVTVVYTVIVMAASWTIAVAASVFLQRSFPGRNLMRALFLIPYALPAYAGIIVWRFILQQQNGMLNHVLVDQLGVFADKPYWLLGDNSLVALIVVNVWKYWPFAFLIITAGMQSIPTELYEAAALDGAGAWRRFRSVTLPLLSPVNRTLLLILFLWTFNDFSTPYILFGRSAPPAADLISIHIYNRSFETWNFGLGSAMSVLLVVFLLVCTAGFAAFTRWRDRRA